MCAGVPFVNMNVATVDDTRLLVLLNNSDAFREFGCPLALAMGAINSVAVPAICRSCNTKCNNVMSTNRNLSLAFNEYFNAVNGPEVAVPRCH